MIPTTTSSHPASQAAAGSEEQARESSTQAGAGHNSNSEHSGSCSSSSSRDATGEDDEASTGHQSEQTAEEEGSLLPPHQFALQLMAHDLRTLPAHLSSPPHNSSTSPRNKLGQSPSPPASPAHSPQSAGHPFSFVPPRINSGPQPFLGGHHFTFPPPASPSTTHGSYLNTRMGTGHSPTRQKELHSRQMRSVPEGFTSCDKPWEHWSQEQLRQSLGLSTRPVSASSQPVGAAARLSRPMSASATARRPREEAAAARPMASSGRAGTLSRMAESLPSDATDTGLGAEEGQGEQEHSGMGMGSTISSVRQEMPSLRTMVAGPAGRDWKGEGEGVEQGFEAGASMGEDKQQQQQQQQQQQEHQHQHQAHGTLKYEEWFAQMMGIATGTSSCGSLCKSTVEERAAEKQGRDQGEVGKQHGLLSSASSPKDEGHHRQHPRQSYQRAPHPPSRSVIRLEQEGSAYNPTAVRIDRPSTAPSTRHATSVRPSYSLQVDAHFIIRTHRCVGM
jgi:hypothetical protein